jgi:hypothetical protein
MSQVLAEHQDQVAFAEDQDPVQQLAAQGRLCRSARKEREWPAWYGTCLTARVIAPVACVLWSSGARSDLRPDRDSNAGPTA